MIPSKYIMLIQSLAQKTADSQIFWNRMSETQFKLILSSSVIVIDWWRNSKQVDFVSIDIYDLYGELIDRYTVSKSNNLVDYETLFGYYMQIYSVINNKLENAINNILGEINQSGVVGFKDNAKD